MEEIKPEEKKVQYLNLKKEKEKSFQAMKMIHFDVADDFETTKKNIFYSLYYDLKFRGLTNYVGAIAANWAITCMANKALEEENKELKEQVENLIEINKILAYEYKNKCD